MYTTLLRRTPASSP